VSTLIKNYKPNQGLYIHIPHCLQKCHYCDFPTVLLSTGPDLDLYTEWILKELELKILDNSPLSSIYFGGGTPSLLGPRRIDLILNKINNLYHSFTDNLEITVEINPGTLTFNCGVNRFSLGVQTFNNDVLKIIGREHSAEDTYKTLEDLSQAKVDFTSDLILALPNEGLNEFKVNVKELLKFDPHHLSVYMLTVPELNFLSKHMPEEDLMDQLLDEAENLLTDLGYLRYEISNYRKKNNKPSLHNLLYWNDLSYWGVGLGAHSYLKNTHPLIKSEWGVRFWNPRTVNSYKQQILSRTSQIPFEPKACLPPEKQTEKLQLNESLTDYCFTHLRQWDGLDETEISKKYPAEILNLVTGNLHILAKEGYIENIKTVWRLSKKGRKFADHVFRKLCFSQNDIKELYDRKT
jgi:oxygen-independent coproporphyrinogen III oxidase